MPDVIQTLWRELFPLEHLEQRTGAVGASLVQALLADMRLLFQQAGIAPTSLLLLRVQDVVYSFLLVMELEAALRQPLEPDDSKARDTTGRAAWLREVEAIGRARERLRKAMKELEDTCARMGRPVDGSLAERMLPLLEKTEGVIEDAIAFEQAKKRNSNTGSSRKTGDQNRGQEGEYE